MVEFPLEKKSINVKWIYKTKPDDEVGKSKTRLVATFFIFYLQRHGLDYNEVYAHVAILKTIRLIVAVAKNNLCITRCEVNFLKWIIIRRSVDKSTTMFWYERQINMYKLKKTLYDLKHTPRSWKREMMGSYFNKTLWNV